MSITDRPPRADFTTGSDRKALHAYVSDEAHAAWHDFGAENGVSAPALLEAMAELGTFDTTPEARAELEATTVATHVARLVRVARRIDVQRRRRRP